MENSEDLKRLFALKNHDDMIESKQRIMKAKELMKPFILRRNKHHVRLKRGVLNSKTDIVGLERFAKENRKTHLLRAD